MNSVLISVIVINIVISLLLSLGSAPILVWMERRVAGFIQDRLGPNRCNIGGVRLGGLIQSFADMLKLVFKEDYRPNSIKEKMFFTMAPMIVFATAYLTYMVIPFADDLTIGNQTFMMQGLPFDLGILWFLAFAGLSVYGIILGGWASNNKYSLLGGIRAAAQMVSYEAAMGLSLISILIVYGSVHLGDMVRFQGELIFGFIPAWGVIIQPLAAILFIITSFAETNRAPFDIAEGESEIVGGFHTEYSAMRFGLFFVGEYVAMCAASALIVTLFFGGYQIPWLNTVALKEYFDFVIITIVVVLPIISFYFSKWIKKNNIWPQADDARNMEAKWLINILIGINVVLIALAVGYFVFGLSQNGLNICVAILQIITFFVKLYMMNFVFIWVRWTLPRFRYDQLQNLGWKILLPIALMNIFITAIVVVVLGV
ncbi:complex I subunit 1/NuoH family protein [Sulfurospirillum arcachonense]|uniref:complex I subunit 1/NuoH family protein n=1 Tax=Sulfurospirillum arcachonense TaxID=57666 RepID=UPI0004695C21|nr:complex I subunit 1 family protein [Sulfurospirillum arcachonense]